MIQPYAWTKEEAQIIKAAWATDAGRVALQLVVERLGMLHRSSFDDTSERRSAHSEGRRYVAIELMTVINNPVDRIVKEESNEPRTNGIISATERSNRAAASRNGNAGSKR